LFAFEHFAHFSVNDIFFRHGEKCAGIIGAVLNNSYCGVGMAYNARLGGMSNHGKLNNCTCHNSSEIYSTKFKQSLHPDENVLQFSDTSFLFCFFATQKLK